MLGAVRPYMTAGVALVGASVIAVSPLSPVNPAVASAARAESAAVELAAIPSPFEVYSGLVEKAVTNSAGLVANYFSSPLPIIGAIAKNEIDALAAAAEAFESGDGGAALAALADAGLVPVRAAVAAGRFVFETLLQPESLVGLALVALGPVINGFLAAGAAIGDIIDAVTTADFVGFVNAVINVPGRILDGVINGGYVLGDFFIFPGILSPDDASDAIPAGPIAAIIDLLQTIGRSIRPEEEQALSASRSVTEDAVVGVEQIAQGTAADTSPLVTEPVSDNQPDPLTDQPDISDPAEVEAAAEGEVEVEGADELPSVDDEHTQTPDEVQTETVDEADATETDDTQTPDTEAGPDTDTPSQTNDADTGATSTDTETADAA